MNRLLGNDPALNTVPQSQTSENNIAYFTFTVMQSL